MASGIYNTFKAELMKKTVDLVNDTIKVALLDNDHAFDPDNDLWANVSSNEIANGNGYTTNGKDLAGKAVTVDDTDNEGVFDANDTVWTSSTITAYHAVLYDDSLTDALADMLICSIDFGGVQSSSNGDFKIQWATEGIINLT